MTNNYVVKILLIKCFTFEFTYYLVNFLICFITYTVKVSIIIISYNDFSVNSLNYPSCLIRVSCK